MRFDQFCSRIGHRENGYSRVWIEDSFDRLSRNGFTPGTSFEPQFRPGVGLVLAPTAIGSLTVSQRRGVPLLSYERPSVSHQFEATPDVRVRISVNHVTIMPRLRVFSIGGLRNETWNLSGLTVATPSGSISLEGGSPVHAPKVVQTLRAELTEANLVAATEFMNNVLAPRLELSGEALLVHIAGQFLSDGDYKAEGPGIFVR
jgi:hypothetical protein